MFYKDNVLQKDLNEHCSLRSFFIDFSCQLQSYGITANQTFIYCNDITYTFYIDSRISLFAFKRFSFCFLYQYKPAVFFLCFRKRYLFYICCVYIHLFPNFTRAFYIFLNDCFLNFKAIRFCLLAYQDIHRMLFDMFP